MIPKRGQGANLLVPVCLSASAVAYSSTRIENMFMSVGSAAGVAAQQLVSGEAATVQDVNVTKVQLVLSNIFRQRIHGPPGKAPPCPTPTPKTYTVAGAGATEWNGAYQLKTASGPLGGPVYERDAAACPHGKPCGLYSEGGVWRLATEGVELYYVATKPTGCAPPLDAGGWSVANGTAPPPQQLAPSMQ